MGNGYLLLDYNRSIKSEDGDYTVGYVCDDIETIDIGAFGCWKNLREITLPSNVKTIGHGAFRECFNLSKIRMSQNINYIGREAFVGCLKLKHYEQDNRYFKILKKDMTDTPFRNTKFEIGEWKVIPYNNGRYDGTYPYYAYSSPAECFNSQHGKLEDLRFFEVMLGDDVRYGGEITPMLFPQALFVSTKIKLVKEYTFEEFLDLAGIEILND